MIPNGPRRLSPPAAVQGCPRPSQSPQLEPPRRELASHPSRTRNRGRERVIARLRRSAAALTSPPAPPAAAEPLASLWPLDLDPTAQIHLARGSNRPIPVNPRPFCRLALKFPRNQPALHLSSKVIAFRPLRFSKIEPVVLDLSVLQSNRSV
jgi:hypothetical protein